MNRLLNVVLLMAALLGGAASVAKAGDITQGIKGVKKVYSKLELK